MYAIQLITLLIASLFTSAALALPAPEVSPTQQVFTSNPVPQSLADISACDFALADIKKGHKKPGSGDENKSIYQVIKEDEAFTKLAGLLEERKALANALDDKDANVTLFAPVDDAFKHHKGCPGKKPPADLITKVLLYHIVAQTHKSEDLENGQLLDTGLTLESLGDRPQKIRVFEHKHHVALNLHSHLIADDIKASNGIIQAVDHIILPPPNAYWLMGHFPLEFGLFRTAVKKAGLQNVLKETAAITVFAPSNRAFKNLGWKRLKYLFSHEGAEDLRKIVSYHISQELVYTPDIYKAKQMTLSTLEGVNLNIEVKEKDKEHGHKHRVIEINDEAHVFITDAISANGVIHAIDKVLSPVEEAGKKYFAMGCDEEDKEEIEGMDEVMRMIVDLDV